MATLGLSGTYGAEDLMADVVLPGLVGVSGSVGADGQLRVTLPA
jgi:hypothetical protein